MNPEHFETLAEARAAAAAREKRQTDLKNISLPVEFFDAEFFQPETPGIQLVVFDIGGETLFGLGCYFGGEWWDATQFECKFEEPVQAWAECPVFPFDELAAKRRLRGTFVELRGQALAEVAGNAGGVS